MNSAWSSVTEPGLAFAKVTSIQPRLLKSVVVCLVPLTGSASPSLGATRVRYSVSTWSAMPLLSRKLPPRMVSV